MYQSLVSEICDQTSLPSHEKTILTTIGTLSDSPADRKCVGGGYEVEVIRVGQFVCAHKLLLFKGVRE